MRIDVKKFLFIGIEQERLAFFLRAQEAGLIDFIDTSGIKGKDVSPEIQQILAAIKVLRGLPISEQEEIEQTALADGLAHKILQLKHRREKLAEELRLVRLEIARVEVFGNFSPEDIKFIEKEGTCKVQFFFAKHGIAVDNPLPPEVIFVGSEHELDYFVAINDQSKQYDNLVELRIERPLGQLETHLRAIAHELHETELHLKGYAKYNTFLHHALIDKLNTFNLYSTQDYVKLTMDDELFAVEGWVAANKLENLHQLLNKMQVHVEEIAIEPTDRIPTYLQNEGIRRIGEDVVRVYDAPSARDKDPSLWVLLSFALFFAFIIGDGGYGLIFLAIALYLRYKYAKITKQSKRLLNLFTILGVACIAWGLLTNAFFGINFSPENPIKKVSLLNWLVEKKVSYHIKQEDSTYADWVKKYPQLTQDSPAAEFIGKSDIESKAADNIMMEMALFIGCVHILISLARYLPRNWPNIGWMLFIIGAYLYLPEYLDATTMLNYVFGVNRAVAAKEGMFLMLGGVSIAVVLAIFKHKFLGIFEVMTVIQVFADILSYLRLYALALAGAIVAGIINDAAQNSPFVVGIVLTVVAHAFNIVLSVMSGVIHGLRLNFIEWYHYSFEGGGKMFKPLQKMYIE